jgi:ATP-dependent DNA helicase RecQ
LSKIKFIEPEIVFDDIQENTIFINFENEISKKNNFSILVDSVFGDDSLPSLWIEDRIPYRIDNQSNEHVEILTYFLKTIFNFNQFREGQINIIANFLNGRNTIGVLPTGAGKSLTYYISVILQPKIALVIAPILALMKDQVQKLEQNFKLNYVTTISSMNDNESNEERLLLFKNARVMFTLVSPERLQSEKFRDALVKLSNEESIGAVVLDEVHCLSEWGHDFRPSYLMLSTTLNAFAPNAKFLGLTATASINVVKDIMIELRIRSSSDVKFVSKLKRKNLSFKITKVTNEEAIAKHIIELLIKSNRNDASLLNVTPKGSDSNCGIIFCTTKSDRKPTGTGKLYNDLEPYIGSALGRFDGDYKEDQDPFMSNEKTLLIATKAFGMGIDKPNIRFTIHAGMPPSREAFYQEAGRAGRDNKDANCILISGNDDDGTNKRSLIQEFLNIKTPVSRLKEISKSTKSELGYVDISTHFYFMSNEINEPEQEANRLFELYKEIYDYVNLSKNYVFTRKVNRDDSKNFEQYFVQLHKLGIINNYTVRYGFMVEFKIDIHHLHHQFDHLKEKAIEYLKTYDANSDLVNVLERYSSLNDVPKLLFLLRRWYHDTFIRTKREQLANVHTFINRHIDSDSDKIQEEIEQFFDLSSYFKDEKKTSEFSETDSYGEIVDKVFNVVEEDISKKIIATEFLIESIVNTRIDVYISLLHLRDGKSFIQENNGRQRFEYALSNLGIEDRKVLKEKVITYYDRLSLNSRIWIIESFEKEGMPILGDIFNRYPSDEISYKMSLSIRNQTLNSIMKGEK